jgi:hypothetical protein
MRAVIIRLNTLQKPFEKQIFQFFVVTLLFSIIASFFNTKLLAYYGWLNSNEAQILKKNLVLLVTSGAFYFFVYFVIWNLIYFTYHYVSKSRKQQLDTLQAGSTGKRAGAENHQGPYQPAFYFQRPQLHPCAY